MSSKILFGHWLLFSLFFSPVLIHFHRNAFMFGSSLEFDVSLSFIGHCCLHITDNLVKTHLSPVSGSHS